MSDAYDNVPDRMPTGVYAQKEQYVSLAMKHMTAKRMVGWLRAFAEYAEVAGQDVSAKHARNVADRLEYQVEREEADDE